MIVRCMRRREWTTQNEKRLLALVLLGASLKVVRQKMLFEDMFSYTYDVPEFMLSFVIMLFDCKIAL